MKAPIPFFIVLFTLSSPFCFAANATLSEQDAQAAFGKFCLTYRGSEAMLKGILSNDTSSVQKGNPNGQIWPQGSPYAFTPLGYATYLGKKDIVKVLIHMGAEVNAQDGNGKTALCYAADLTYRHKELGMEIGTLLMMHGAQPTPAAAFIFDSRNATTHW